MNVSSSLGASFSTAKQAEQDMFFEVGRHPSPKHSEEERLNTYNLPQTKKIVPLTIRRKMKSLEPIQIPRKSLRFQQHLLMQQNEKSKRYLYSDSPQRQTSCLCFGFLTTRKSRKRNSIAPTMDLRICGRSR
jgi:hypothetical protein